MQSMYSLGTVLLTTSWTEVTDDSSTCDKHPIECPSPGCHGNQGYVLFNPAYRQRLLLLTNSPAGQLLFVCVKSGTEGLLGLVVLMIMHKVQHRVCVRKSVCLSVWRSVCTDCLYILTDAA